MRRRRSTASTKFNFALLVAVAPILIGDARSTATTGYGLDFNSVSTNPYSNQQQTGFVSVQDAGATLVLTDNTWRVTDQTFDITAGTILEFDFESTAEGEVQAIGFDEDNFFENADRMFKLYGTQVWGIADFNNYSGSGQTHYQIPVGQYYTGSAMNLVFANDDDAGVGSNSRFSNVRISSCPNCLDFIAVSTGPYSSQQQTGSVSVEGSGSALMLTNNIWRVTEQTFYITADTILEFGFESTAEGEVQAIGFDEDNLFENADRMFKLYGTQVWGIADFNNYSGGGQAHYQIPVGQYYTGNAMNLVFANDDDAAVGSDSRFSNVKLIGRPNYLYFDAVSTILYSSQQQTGTVSVEDSGTTLVLTDNTWRVTDQAFDITEDTILEFDFESTAEGEVQAIGFDEDSFFENADRMFKLYGTQTWGIADFNTYSGGGQTHYQIPVGQYYTGNAMNLVFANDDDAAVGSNSRFSNVRVHPAPSQGQGRPWEAVLDEAKGFGRIVSGGKGAQLITVTNLNGSGSGSLRAALAAPGPSWIRFTPGLGGTINMSSSLEPKSNTTIDGRGANITLDWGQSGYGFFLFNSSNVILMYLKLKGAGFDLVHFREGFDGGWLHHITFGNALDEQLSVRNGADNITVSWCRFDDNGIGSPGAALFRINNEPVEFNNIYSHVSMHHNYWTGDINARVPKMSNVGHFHMYNEYSAGNANIHVVNNAELLLENSILIPDTFGGRKLDSSESGQFDGLSNAVGNLLLNGARLELLNSGIVFEPPYSYVPDPATTATRDYIVVGAGWQYVPFPD